MSLLSSARHSGVRTWCRARAVVPHRGGRLPARHGHVVRDRAQVTQRKSVASDLCAAARTDSRPVNGDLRGLAASAIRSQCPCKPCRTPELVCAPQRHVTSPVPSRGHGSRAQLAWASCVCESLAGIGTGRWRRAASHDDRPSLWRVRWVPIPSHLATRRKDAFLEVVDRNVAFPWRRGRGRVGLGRPWPPLAAPEFPAAGRAVAWSASAGHQDGWPGPPASRVQAELGPHYLGVLRLLHGFRAEAQQDRFGDRRVIERACDTVRGSTHAETTIAGTRTP